MLSLSSEDDCHAVVMVTDIFLKPPTCTNNFYGGCQITSLVCSRLAQTHWSCYASKFPVYHAFFTAVPGPATEFTAAAVSSERAKDAKHAVTATTGQDGNGAALVLMPHCIA